ncbi:hypothetical protein BH11PSE12_BH11PSE12_25990 [soil metagenome]
MMRVFLACLLLFGVAFVTGVAAAPVKACGGDSNWPPMSYIKHPGQAVEGFSADILRSVFSPQPEISLRPWARCLVEVLAYQRFDIAMSLFKTPERETQFLFSRSYYSLTPSYMYAATRFAAPPILQLSDLAKYKVCALHGASIFYTKLPGSAIDSGAPNYSSLIKKLERGYCDVVVDMHEVFTGFFKLDLLPFDARQYPIVALPGTEKYLLHFGVAKQHPEAAAIIGHIDSGLQELQRNGKLGNLIMKYQK